MNTKKIERNMRPSKLFFKLWKKLSKRRKLQTYFALLIMILSGICELISFAALIPFLIIITNPEKLFENNIFKYISLLFGLNSDIEKLLFTTFLFIFIALFASSIKLINIWLNNRIAALIGRDLTVKVLEKLLNRSYADFIKGSTSEIITLLNSNSNRVTNTVLGILLGISSCIVLLFIIAPIFIINPSLSISSVFFFGVIYLIITKLTTNKLASTSSSIDKNLRNEISIIYDSIGSIRNLIIERKQDKAVQSFKSFDEPYRLALANQIFLGSFPRVLLEGIGISFVALIGFLSILQKNNVESIIAILGTIGLAAQKLLPAFQQIYRSWSLINSSKADISNILKILEEPYEKDKVTKLQKPLKFRKSLRFENISFSYDKNSSDVLKNISFEIKAGEKIGIIGSSGSGKSTLIDLMMGLLIPSSGKIFIDENNLHNKNKKDFILSWHQTISHVPQNIFLSNSTIYSNITFSENHKNINLAKLKKASKLSLVEEFINNNPENYSAKVGERGIKLSGGQRQRIGIARAIYRDKDVLFLDEATSALDLKTEQKILNSLMLDNKNLTIIMISHRINTLKNCNRILKIENGLLVDQGDPLKFIQ